MKTNKAIFNLYAVNNVDYFIYIFMQLSQLLKGIKNTIIFGNVNKNIKKLSQNSKKIANNSLFFCIVGTKTDGLLYVDEAVKSGATAVVLSKSEIKTIEKIKEKCKKTTFVFVDDVRKSMAKISANFYGNPQKKLKIVGITGTNGKTSCSYIIAGLLKQFGKKVGVIGTSGIFISSKKYEASLTTPDSIELFEIFAKMVKKDVEFCIMEVSAHSIYFNKIFGIKFAIKALTNVDSDHLDFFKTQKNYAKTKMKFFKKNDTSVLNNDDATGTKIAKKIQKSQDTNSAEKVLKFGKSENSNLCFFDESLALSKTDFKLKFGENVFDIRSNLTGKFNVYNVILSIGVLIQLGFDFQKIIELLPNIKSISGRFDVVFQSESLGVIIDYAHTTDSLKNLLQTVSRVSNAKKIIVFGCPGERDSTKRFEMGKLAGEFCDEIVLTSDNPASENPKRIMFEMQCGALNQKSENNIFLLENREKAIKKAIFLAKRHKKCNILIVGKGTEEYQIVGKRKIAYSDYEVVKRLLN